jgi:hypothetical protein
MRLSKAPLRYNGPQLNRREWLSVAVAVVIER